MRAYSAKAPSQPGGSRASAAWSCLCRSNSTMTRDSGIRLMRSYARSWQAVEHNASIDTTRGPALVRSSANALSLPPLHSRVASAVVFE